MRCSLTFPAFVFVILLMPFLVGCGGGGSSAGNSGAGSISGVMSSSLLTAASPVTVSVDGTKIATQTTLGQQFTLANVPAGMHTLLAQSASYAAAIVVEVTAGHVSNIGEVVLQNAGQIAGLVTAQSSGNPLSGAMVTVTEVLPTATTATAPLPSRLTYTDTSGSYVVDGLPAGSYLVTISAQGYTTATLSLTVSAGQTTAGDAALVAAATANTGAVGGTVYLKLDDGTLNPLQGVLVQIMPPNTAYTGLQQFLLGQAVSSGQAGPMIPSAIAYAFTDENGAYLIKGLTPGAYTAIASRDGLNNASMPVTITANTTANVNFTLTMIAVQFAMLEGTVSDSVSKLPIANATVTAIIAPVMTPLTPDNGTFIPANPAVCVMSTQTNNQGAYQLAYRRQRRASASVPRGINPMS